MNLSKTLDYKVDTTKLLESYEDFIGIYRGFFPEEFCNEAISYFNFCQSYTPLVKKRKDDYVEDSYLFTSFFERVENPELNRLNKKLTDYFMSMVDLEIILITKRKQAGKCYRCNYLPALQFLVSFAD